MPIILNAEKVTQQCRKCNEYYSFELKKSNLLLYCHVEEDYDNNLITAKTKYKISSYCPYCGADNETDDTEVRDKIDKLPRTGCLRCKHLRKHMNSIQVSRGTYYVDCSKYQCVQKFNLEGLLMEIGCFEPKEDDCKK